jgi:tetratricopeptide (TPR) repeat protein
MTEMDDRSSNKKDMKGGAGITAGRDVTIGDNTGQLAIGEYINQFQIQQPSGEALTKLIQHLDEKRQASVNLKILNSYSPSTLPDYPPRLREFVTENRVYEITQALIYLQEHRILFISGMGGIGKTTLARALLETRPAKVPLPFWFDFAKKPGATLSDVLEQLAGYMNTPLIAQFREEGREAGLDDINRLTDELGKRESPWVIFDNLETALNNRNFHDPGIDSLFTSLRDSTHQAKIIITSRTLPILADGGSLIDILEDNKHELKGLEANFAVDYLVKNGLDEVEQSQLEELALSVDGHPLALKLLIGLVKKFGIKDTLDDLSTFKRHKESTIKKARRLFEKLAGDEKELLEHISVFRQPESKTAIKKMFTATTSEDAVENLMEKSLLETDHEGSYWLHPLVREFAYDDLENKIEVHKIALQYYLSIPLPEERTSKEDIQPLIEAHHHACRAEDYNKALNIIMDNKLHEDLDRWGNSRTLIDLYLDLLPEDHFNDISLLDNTQNHSVVLGNLGNAYKNMGQVEKAIEYYEKVLVIATEIGDRRGEGTDLGNLGNAYNHLGQVEKAIEYYEQALVIATEIGDRRGEENHLGNLGIAYRNLGQVEKAIEYYEKALGIAKEIGDRQGEGNSLGNLGNAYNILGQVEKAIEYYEQVLVITKEIGDKRNEGIWLGNLGLAYSNLGQVEKAIEYYEKALGIAKEIGDKRGEGADLGNLGLAYSILGQIEKAIEYYEQALGIAKEIGDRLGEGNHLGNLGNAYSNLGQVEKAIEYYEKALVIGKEIKDLKIINFCEKNLKSIKS